MKITNLKKVRILKGIKQKELARKSKKSIRAFQDYESGERVPDVHTAIHIAKELDIKTLEELENLFPLPSEKTSTFETSHKNNTTN